MELHRVVADLIDGAARALGNRSTPRSRRVHDVRRAIKRARAALLLMEPAFPRRYRKWNHILRNIGRTLSSLRDADALAQMSEGFRERMPASAIPLFKRVLRAARQAAGRSASERERVVANAAADLRSAYRRWGAESLKPAFDLRRGFQNTYREGRRAFAAAGRRGANDDFHEWRKKVKAHLYQIELAGQVWPEEWKRYRARLKKLSDVLGDHQNLALLHSLLKRAGGKGSAAIFAVERWLQELRGKAMELGAGIFAERPRDLGQRLAALWNVRPAQTGPELGAEELPIAQPQY